MRTPFARPILTIVFYGLAVVIFSLYLLLALGVTGGMLATKGGGLGALFAFSGFVTIFAGGIIAALVAAIGYIIELLAKIEWNTRPGTGETGYAANPTPNSPSIFPNKQYFLSEKGRVVGPLNAAEILALYRDGKISIAAQISVEENGQRRVLKNLSEIGL